ncbi:hypothetical protein LIER_21945 [Lithospermum erythrorhizon]|uniref:Uncharacterized protein n=1 Tax=Lithospermum erythrorhizon TaxID=34254 RepID=A0AAV3QS75_LITER
MVRVVLSFLHCVLKPFNFPKVRVGHCLGIAWAYDDIFQEIDNYPSNHTTSVSADADQALPVGSSNPTLVPTPADGSASQSTNDQGDDSRALPTFIENSLPVSFTDSQLWDFKEYFSIPDDVGGGRLSKNFLAGPRPNKVHPKRFHGQWFFIRGGMGPRVPISWTTQSEVGSLFVRDTAFIRSQVQVLRLAIPVKHSWTTYCQEGSLIMAGLIHDKMCDPRSNPPVT